MKMNIFEYNLYLIIKYQILIKKISLKNTYMINLILEWYQILYEKYSIMKKKNKQIFFFLKNKKDETLCWITFFWK
jgi:hypothetical protein